MEAPEILFHPGWIGGRQVVSAYCIISVAAIGALSTSTLELKHQVKRHAA